MTEIALSVVIPTYNRSSSLAVTLAGLKKQTYPSHLYEVLVVSDGSTDNTAAIVDAYRVSVSNVVRYIQQTNAGPSAARNRGIAEAVNDVVVFLDDDVEPVSIFLERHASWHVGSDRIGVIGPMTADPSRRNIEPTWIRWEHEKLDRVYKMFQPGGPYPEGIGKPVHFYSGNASVKRHWLVKCGGFDTRYTRQEDVEMATRLADNYNIRFVFDFCADGIHRPDRTFLSWLKIPREYGRLDAQRLADGTISFDVIQSNLDNRHVITRVVTKLIQQGTFAATVTIAVLKWAAVITSRMKLHRLASTLLSGLYNAVYCGALFAEQKSQGLI